MGHGTPIKLPEGVTVFERGWLSSNNILLTGSESTALVDTGYCTHAPQTLALVAASLQGRTLDVVVNTHLHSDHCGGNAALQKAYPALKTFIPPGHASCVADWDPYALSYTPTGQRCPQFRFEDVLVPGTDISLGGRAWQIHAAPGHDPHSVILFETASRTLISADALWEAGFGVVFPELDGDDAFETVADTLDLIESLQPVVVIPGHGSPFGDVAHSLDFARKRLEGFVANPAKHRRYGEKALFKFKLLEAQHMSRSELVAWAAATPFFASLNRDGGPQATLAEAVDALIADLARSGAVVVEGDTIYNA